MNPATQIAQATQIDLSLASSIAAVLVAAILGLYRSNEKKNQQLLDLAKELMQSSRRLESAQEKLRRASGLSSNPPPSS